MRLLNLYLSSSESQLGKNRARRAYFSDSPTTGSKGEKRSSIRQLVLCTPQACALAILRPGRAIFTLLPGKVVRPLILLCALTGFSEARAEIALGLSPLCKGFSIWSIRDKALFGFEARIHNLSRRYIPFVENQVTKEREEETHHYCLDLVAKRIVRDGEVPLFIYGDYFVEDKGFKDSRTKLWHDRTTYGVILGLGGMWQPWEKVSVIVRHGMGFAVEFYDKGGPILGTDEDVSSTAGKPALVNVGWKHSEETYSVQAYNMRFFILFHL